MKTVILAGGYGTRISEESRIRPKPMIEIGEHPILWHILKIYSAYGIRDFVLCLGYKSGVIKNYFLNYHLYQSDVAVDTGENKHVVLSPRAEPWNVTLAETGLNTMTGGRIKRVRDYIGNETFLLTYGDGVADIHIPSLIEFHRAHGKLATLTAVQPAGRFGSLKLGKHGQVTAFKEKKKGDDGWINGGFFVLEPEVLDLIEGDGTVFEKEPLERLAKDGQLMAYKHPGFWHPMDTIHDRDYLNGLWNAGRAPWNIWSLPEVGGL